MRNSFATGANLYYIGWGVLYIHTKIYLYIPMFVCCFLVMYFHFRWNDACVVLSKFRFHLFCFGAGHVHVTRKKSQLGWQPSNGLDKRNT